MSFAKIIKDYLVGRANSDAAFAEKFYDRMNKEGDKAIEGCCSYIKNQARKEAQSGCAVIEDAKVFGWAMHYIDENIAAPATTAAARVETAPTTEQLKEESLERGRKAGIRLETIEVDTTRWKIIQCRGRFNQDSSHHKAILNLMEKNMNMLRMAN